MFLKLNFCIRKCFAVWALLLLLWVGLCAPKLQATDYLWLPADSNSGFWNDSANWADPATEQRVLNYPDQSSDLAILGYSNTPNVTLGSNTNLGAIAMGGSNPTGPSLSTNGFILNLYGAGFESNPHSTSGQTQGTLEIFGDGGLYLWNSASAWIEGLVNYSTLAFYDSSTAAGASIKNHGSLIFGNDATGGTASITNYSQIYLYNQSTLGPGSATILDNQGTMSFHDSSNAGGESINNEGGAFIHFYDSSNALNANIQNNGAVSFHNSATASGATIGNYNGSSAINFHDSSTAGNATLNNNSGKLAFDGVATAGSAVITNGGSLTFSGSSTGGTAGITNYSTGMVTFYDHSNAGSATLLNSGSMQFQRFSSAGGASITNNNSGSESLAFSGYSTAATAAITNNGQAGFHGNSSAGSSLISNSDASLFFYDSASAGSAAITNSGYGTVSFNNNSSAGNSTITNSNSLSFNDNSSAGSSSIINDHKLFFYGSASGGKAAVVTDDGASTDLSGLTSGGTTLGSVDGAGYYFLGSNNLTVGSLGRDMTVSGSINDGGKSGGAGGSLTKTGPGNLMLTGNNSYTGVTTIEGGTLTLAGDGNLATGGDLTFAGKGKFNYIDTSTSTQPQGAILGMLTLSSGDGTVQSTFGAGVVSSANIVFYGLATRAAGATGNFVVSGGSNGLTNNIYIGDGSSSIFTGSGIDPSHFHAAGFIDQGTFFGGNNYAVVDSGGYVRGLNYGVDANSVSSPGGTSLGGALTSLANVKTTGAITHQTSVSINTLNLGANGFALDPSQVLTVNGILESGGAAVLGGGSIQTGSGPDLVIRADTSTDSLTINSDIVNTSALTKSGSGMLVLNRLFNGVTYLNDGGMTISGTVSGDVTVGAGANFKVGSSGAVNGNVTASGNGATVGGSGHINGSIIVADGASSYPGDPTILTGSNAEYKEGATAQFAINTGVASGHPPVAGVDYDRVVLTSGGVNALVIDAGLTTLQLNFTTLSLAQIQANAANSILDHYFLFQLGTGTSSGQFTDLTLSDGTNIYTDPIINGVADISQIGLEFQVGYTGNAVSNSTTGGNDVVVTAMVPEPGTGLMLLCGIGMLAGLRMAGLKRGPVRR